MAAARQKAVKGRSTASQWRNGAYAAINICWKQMFPDADREERLDWIARFLGVGKVDSITDLSDEALGAVAGKMKELTGAKKTEAEPRRSFGGGRKSTAFPLGESAEPSGNVVSFPAGKNPVATAPGSDPDAEVSFAASPEQVYTLEKLEQYLGWPRADMAEFLKKRFKCTAFKMLRWKQAHSCIHQILMIAAHRDLKKRKMSDVGCQMSDAEPKVSRKEIAKYMPMLKQGLNIDQGGA